jgi:AbrB family looped-hinge helix DNA binding protein
MTVTVKSKMPIVVPPSVRRLAGFKSGDKLEFKVSGGIVSILPKRDSGDTLTPEEAKVVRRG